MFTVQREFKIDWYRKYYLNNYGRIAESNDEMIEYSCKFHWGNVLKWGLSSNVLRSDIIDRKSRTVLLHLLV